MSPAKGIKRFYKLCQKQKAAKTDSVQIDFSLSLNETALVNFNFVSIKLKERMFRGERAILVQIRDITDKVKDKLKII